MNKLLSLVGFTAVAVISGTVAYLYVNDREVRTKIDRAVSSVGDAVREVKRSVELNRLARNEERANPTERNQAWVDEQWEALGI